MRDILLHLHAHTQFFFNFYFLLFYVTHPFYFISIGIIHLFIVVFSIRLSMLTFTNYFLSSFIHSIFLHSFFHIYFFSLIHSIFLAVSPSIPPSLPFYPAPLLPTSPPPHTHRTFTLSQQDSHKHQHRCTNTGRGTVGLGGAAGPVSGCHDAW